MKSYHLIKIILLFGFLFNNNAFSIDKNTLISDLILKVNKDTLYQGIREFTGEDSVVINGVQTIIRTRNIAQDSGYTTKAEDYIIERFQDYGYIALADTFNHFKMKNSSSPYDYRHIYAVKQGIKNKDKKLYITAHLDCVGDYYYLNYGADDNASGVIAVLHLANILSKVELDYTIVFYIFNSEEYLSYAPTHFSKDTVLKNQIFSVINLDMIGYDGNDDGLVNIYSIMDTTNLIIELIKNMNSLYEIGLNIQCTLGFVGDELRFFPCNFPMVSIGEDKLNYDFNPYYHTNFDRVEFLNFDFYQKITKLALSTIFVLASDKESSVNYCDTNELLFYPNPARDYISITQFTDSSILKIYNTYGECLISQDVSKSNLFNQSVNISNLPNGFYIIHFGNQTEKLIVVK